MADRPVKVLCRVEVTVQEVPGRGALAQAPEPVLVSLPVFGSTDVDEAAGRRLAREAHRVINLTENVAAFGRGESVCKKEGF